MSKRKPIINKPDTQFQEDHYVVAIGASAGGMEAIHDLFDQMPENTGFSFIIIQHLSSDYKSLIAELLAKHTKMKITEAGNFMTVEPNSVYVIPNNKNIILQDGKLCHLEKGKTKSPNMAIDIFLESLAIDKKEKAIAIILSGTGSDGTKGIQEIKRGGGLVFVQDPSTAKFDGMPVNAINSGIADFILSPQSIPEELLLSYKEKRVSGVISETIPMGEETTLHEVLNYLKSTINSDFTHYKKATISRRLTRRMALLNLKSLEEYFSFLKAHPDEAFTLSKEFLIGVTQFFRDEEAFDFLKSKVIPELLKDRSPSESIKIWVAGCSTGEEAYSMAIVFNEYLKESGKHFDIKIFASDLDKNAIEYAAKGYYPESISKVVSRQRLDTYFIKEGSRYKIDPDIRKIVIFSHHDLGKDAPFSRIDLISCRNMLIYFDTALQNRCMSLFHFSLNLGGYLFLGPSETIGEIRDYFSEVNKKWKIYKNTFKSKGLRLDGLPKSNLLAQQISLSSTKNVVAPDVFAETLLNSMLEEGNGAAVYIDANFNLVNSFGDYKRYLELPAKKFEPNILKMVPEDLSVILSTNCRKALKDQEKIKINNYHLVKDKKRQMHVDVSIFPFAHEQSFDRKVLLILFRESTEKSNSKPGKKQDKNVSMNIDHYLMLERELKETKETLQRSIELSESANEELQSSNEELISANEELQSTNEELHSLNEELHTVNTEHQLKIKEISELNDDLNNYFRSTDIGQIFLDRNLIIRKYTPTATVLINLIETDIGRPLTHISYNMKYTDLVSDLAQVIKTSQPIKKVVEVNDHTWYQITIMPYIRDNRQTDGVILAFVDVSDITLLNTKYEKANLELKRFNTELEEIVKERTVEIEGQKHMLQDLFMQAPAIICTLSGPEHVFELVNPLYQRLFGDRKLQGKKVIEALPELKGQGIIEMLDGVYTTGNPFIGNEIKMMLSRSEGGPIEEIYFNFIYQAKYDQKKKIDGIFVFAYEVTDQVKARMTLEETNQKINFIIDSLSMISWSATSEGKEDFFNKTWYEYSGLDFKSSCNGGWAKAIHEEDLPKALVLWTSSLKEKVMFEVEYRFRRRDGMYRWHLGRCIPVKDAKGNVIKWVGTATDIHDQKLAQEELNTLNQELRITNSQLQQINIDLDNFIYTASHDLKAPVSNIEGLVHTLADILKNEPSVKEETEPILDMVHESIKRFSGTIKDLTTITKIQKNVDEAEETVTFKEQIEGVMVSVRDLIVNSQASFKVNCEVNEIRFSRKHLYSILYNLISNAIKYKSPDRKPEIHIQTQKYGSYILLEVRDNGLGIAPIHRDKMFTMFKRFHDHVEGTGVGLYIVKRILDNTGGKIEVESEVGKGTIFKIYFKA